MSINILSTVVQFLQNLIKICDNIATTDKCLKHRKCLTSWPLVKVNWCNSFMYCSSYFSFISQLSDRVKTVSKMTVAWTIANWNSRNQLFFDESREEISGIVFDIKTHSLPKLLSILKTVLIYIDDWYVDPRIGGPDESSLMFI